MYEVIVLAIGWLMGGQVREGTLIFAVSASVFSCNCPFAFTSTTNPKSSDNHAAGATSGNRQSYIM